MVHNEKMLPNLLVFGGSFDPPHGGHLKAALDVQRHFHFERFMFLPCKTPLLKEKTMATCDQRLHMLQLMLAAYPEFEIDRREINRKSPSFMVETLENFRQEFGPNTAITLLIGMDNFLQLPQWHRWQDIVQLANLLIIKRDAKIKSQIIPKILKPLLSTHETMEKNDLFRFPHGKIYRYDAGSYSISSTWLRQQIKQDNNTIQACLPAVVYQYIKEQGLYSDK